VIANLQFFRRAYDAELSTWLFVTAQKKQKQFNIKLIGLKRKKYVLRNEVRIDSNDVRLYRPMLRLKARRPTERRNSTELNYSMV